MNHLSPLISYSFYSLSTFFIIFSPLLMLPLNYLNLSPLYQIIGSLLLNFHHLLNLVTHFCFNGNHLVIVYNLDLVESSSLIYYYCLLLLLIYLLLYSHQMLLIKMMNLLLILTSSFICVVFVMFIFFMISLNSFTQLFSYSILNLYLH
jgi:hypothetical protein